ncbi:hypothetical protein GF337_19230 [candidate division KSB1 bacterium]|nr:hypothetical protein [candidate division KSB1 bacterium]
MGFKELWSEYETCTKELTENTRKLAFAGAAICWFFRSPEVTFPTSINFALFFIVAFFTFDIFQFLSATLLMKFWIQHKETEIEQRIQKNEKITEDDFMKPAWLNQGPFTFFILKILFLFGAFIALGNEFFSRIT